MKRTAVGLGAAMVALMSWSLHVGTVQAAAENDAAKPEFTQPECSRSSRQTATAVTAE